MDGSRRLRLELDPDTFELHSYFAKLRGLPVGMHIRKVLASYASSAEDEFPTMRAHMLSWRQAQEAQRSVDEQSAKLAAYVVGEGAEDLDAIPY